MNVEELFNRGSYLIPNPAYNPKAKRNRQAPYIQTQDDREYNPVADLFYRNANNNFTVRDTEKYNPYNITVRPGLNPAKELSNAQSDWAKIGNALAQTLVSEVGLGTFRGISDMTDYLTGAAFRNDNDYSNPVSQYIQSLQDKFDNEIAPIYADPDLDISNGGLTDVGWWAKNIPSIASSLTLLLPSTGFVKGLSWLGKATKLNSYTRKAVSTMGKALAQQGNIGKGIDIAINKPGTINTVNRFIENGLTAASSRIMENYQESSQVWKDQYNDNIDVIAQMSDEEYARLVERNADILQGIDTSNKDAVAKRLAKEAADRTFAIDMSNIGFDIVELYGLRNSFGKGMLGKNSSYSIRKAARQRARYADQLKGVDEKTITEQVRQLEKARSFGQKTADFISDFVPGEAFTVGSQLSEGAEEAINYVAQEEGMHLGKQLLGKDDYSSFDTRMISYLNAPQLWESAFWGALGGVVFQKVGSGFKRVQLTLEDAAAEKENKNKDNEKTGEQKAETSWKGLTQLPEVKRKVASIWDAQIKMNMAEDAIQQVKDNDKFSDFEKEQQIDDIRNRTKADIVLRSINDGTVDLLDGFVESDNVKKAMIDKGIINQKDADEWQMQMKKDIKDIQDRYNRNIINLDRQAANIDSEDKGKYIAIEAIQMAATDNVYRELQIEENNKNAQKYLSAYEDEIGRKSNPDAPVLNPELNYRSALELTTYTAILQDLYVERAKLRESIKNGDTLAKRIALQNIDTQIKSVKRSLVASEEEFSISKMLYTMSNVSDNLKLLGTETALEDVTEMDKAITDASEKQDFKSLYKLFDSDYKSTINSASTVDRLAFQQEYKKIQAETREAIRGKQGINQVAPDAADNYRAYIQLQYQNKLLASNLVQTKDQLQNYLTRVNNTLNEARINALKDASVTIENLFDKYGRDVVEGSIAALYDGNENDFNIASSDMNEEERKQFKEAIEIFNFANKANTPLYRSLQVMFAAREKANNKQAKATEETTERVDSEDEKELNSTNSNSSQTTQNPQPTNSSQTVPQSNTEQATRQKQDTTNNQSSKQGLLFKLDDGSTVELKGNFSEAHGNTDSNGTTYVRTYEATEDEYKYSELFDLDRDVNLLDDNAQLKVIVKPKQITYTDKFGNVTINWEKGKIVNANNSTPVEEIPATETSTPAPTPLEQLANQKKTEVANDKPTSPTPSNGTTSNSSTGGMSEGDEIVNRNNRAVTIIKNFNGQGNYDDVITALKEEFKDDPDQEAVEALIKGLEPALKAKFSVGDVLMASRLLEEATNAEDVTAALDLLNSAASDMLTKYIAATNSYVFTNSDGITKKIISLENLLRWCNEVSNNDTTADAMYSVIKSYLEEQSKNPNYEYIVMDKFDSQDAILARAKKDIPTANVDKLGFIEEHRIGVNTVISAFQRSLDTERLNNLYNVLEHLKVGDKLSTRKIGNQIALEVNGQVIAYMSIPKVSKPDTYFVRNEGWNYEINCNTGESPLKDRFNSWLSEETDDAKKINQLIFELCNKKEISKADLKHFMNTNAIKKAISDELIDDSIDPSIIVNSVVKLWRYVGTSATVSRERINLAISNSLDNWFDKLKTSYNTIYNVGKSVSHFDFTISRINSPRIRENVRYNGTNIAEVRSKATPIAESLTIDNQQSFEIAYKPMSVDENGNIDRYSMQLSNGSKLYLSDTSQIKPGTTMIALTNGNGETRLTSAFSVLTKDSCVGKEAKQISKELFEELQNLVDDYFNQEDGSGTNLIDFIDNLWRNGKVKNNNRHIFGGPLIHHITNNNGVDIGVLISLPNKKYVRIFKTTGIAPSYAVKLPNDNRAVNLSKVSKDQADDIKKQLKEFFKEAFAVSTYELNYGALDYESNKKRELNGFFKANPDGSFRIEIPNSKDKANPHVHNIISYKSFILDNNLIRVNVAKSKNYNGDDTNFYSFDNEEQIANQSFYVKITPKEEFAEESENENSTESQSEINLESDKIESDVRNILQSDNTDKGVALANILLGKDEIKKVKNLILPIQGFGLLPKNIIFVENIGNIDKKLKDAYAAYDEKTGNIYVSNKWIGLCLTPRRRNEAVRKLIHEQLHKILHDSGKKDKILNKVNEVFDDFKKEVDSGKWKGNSIAKEFTKYGIEEFLVESLTNSNLVQLLNETSAVVDNKATSKTLFQKILEIISDVFGWDIKKNSLREKEFIALGDLIKTNDLFSQTEDTTDTEDTTETQTEKTEGIEYEDDIFASDDDDDILGSRIGEHPSIGAYIDSLPNSSKEQMIDLIDSGNISIKCK